MRISGDLLKARNSARTVRVVEVPTMSPKVSQEFVEAMLKENRELRYALKQILQCRNIAQAKDLAKLALMQPMDAR